MASSPMTATSSELPGLTVGGTASTSPSPLSLLSPTRTPSASLSPPPAAADEVDELDSGDDAPVLPKAKGKAARGKAPTKAPAKPRPTAAKATSTAVRGSKAVKGASGASKVTAAVTAASTPKTSKKRKSLAVAEGGEAGPDAAALPEKKKAKKEPQPAPKAASGKVPKGKDAQGKAARVEKSNAEDKAERGTYCHQCRSKCDPEDVLRCTRLRKYTKHQPERACNLAWCVRDLEKRYMVDVKTIRERGHDVNVGELDKHDADKAYVFTCPCCNDGCQNATCRSKKDRPLLGDVVKLAAEQGITPLEFVRRTDEKHAQARPSNDADADSDLTDIDAPAGPKKGAKKMAAGKKKATDKKKVTDKGKRGGKDGKPAAMGKGAKGSKKEVKDTKRATKATKAEVEVKPKKIVRPPVEPPLFKLVNPKLGYDEIEHRLYLREFVNRFRSLISVPDRSVSQLDDFDHPLSEALVRQIAGGMLDLIILDEGISNGLTREDLDMITEKREELRHYADLARFAQVYKEVAGPLHLTMLQAETPREHSDRQVRALLGLGAHDAAPTWAAIDGPSRRAAASRLPSASEVIRMLIAMAEHTIFLDAVRSTLDPAVGNQYHDHVRQNIQYNREENARWDKEKKAVTKANRAAAEHEHAMRLRAGQVALAAVAARKQTKFAPIGTDPDGRVYFALTPRLIDEERYRPGGWTRGVLVWGPGVPQQAEGDELPTQMPRWSQFSSAADARQLAKWLEYRVNEVIDEAEAAEAQRAKNAKKPKKTAASAVGAAVNGTPKRTLNGMPNDTPNNRPGPSRRRSTLSAVVIPMRGKGTREIASSDLYDGSGDADSAAWSDTESDLSEAPETAEDLLALLDPPGYVPGVERAREGLALVAAVERVASFLEVLEWKGYA